MELQTKRPRSMRTISIYSITAATILAIATFVVIQLSLATQREESRTNVEYQRCQEAVQSLQDASDYLTTEARQFATTGEVVHLNNYLHELTEDDRRASALHDLRENASNNEAVAALSNARTQSDELAEVELYALRLAADAHGIITLPESLRNVTITDADASLSSEEKLLKANTLLTDNDYTAKKLNIHDDVQTCSDQLVHELRTELEATGARLATLLVLLHLFVLLLVVVVALMFASTAKLLLQPIARYGASIRANEPLEPDGAQELRYLILAYNDMYEQTTARTQSLDHEAHNDALTGVLNRGSFDALLTKHKGHSALILVDIDNFKQFNDEQGHEMGDAILVEVAATLYSSFRSSDYVCRIGGDEFAVIMVDAHPGLKNEIARKISNVATFLRDESNGLPAATISVGIAFGSPGCADDALFAAADGALYEVKRKGRDGFAFAKETV